MLSLIVTIQSGTSPVTTVTCGNPIQLEKNSTVTLTASAISSTYSWTVGSQTYTTPTVTVPTNTIGPISCMVTATQGTNTASCNIPILIIPYEIVNITIQNDTNSFNVSNNANVNIVQNTNLTLTASVAIRVSMLTYFKPIIANCGNQAAITNYPLVEFDAIVQGTNGPFTYKWYLNTIRDRPNGTGSSFVQPYPALYNSPSIILVVTSGIYTQTCTIKLSMPHVALTNNLIVNRPKIAPIRNLAINKPRVTEIPTTTIQVSLSLGFQPVTVVDNATVALTPPPAVALNAIVDGTDAYIYRWYVGTNTNPSGTDPSFSVPYSSIDNTIITVAVTLYGTTQRCTITLETLEPIPIPPTPTPNPDDDSRILYLRYTEYNKKQREKHHPRYIKCQRYNNMSKIH